MALLNVHRKEVIKMTETENKKAPAYDVYHIMEREGAKSIWTKIGSALLNKDGSINVFLDALPVDGRLQIRQSGPSK